MEGFQTLNLKMPVQIRLAVHMTEKELIEKYSLKSYHCDSCHEDSDLGYGMCEIEDEGEYIEVCCKIYQEYNLLPLLPSSNGQDISLRN